MPVLLCFRGSAVALNDGRIALYNLKDGIEIFDKFTRVEAARFEISPCTSQAISVFSDGSYLAGISTKGRIRIFRCRDGAPSGVLQVPGLVSAPHSMRYILFSIH